MCWVGVYFVGMIGIVVVDVEDVVDCVVCVCVVYGGVGDLSWRKDEVVYGMVLMMEIEGVVYWFCFGFGGVGVDDWLCYVVICCGWWCGL